MLRSLYIFSLLIAMLNIACKKQLDVKDPNIPSLSDNVTTEDGLTKLAQGSTFINGFVNGDNWGLGDSYFSLPYGYSELLGDVLGAESANQAISVVSVPDKVTTEDGTTITNPSPQIGFLRASNNRAATGAGTNVYYYQWLNMYALNSAENALLGLIGTINLTQDAANTFRAWAYWWKGYAYASIGSQYYSGIVEDQYNITNSNYVGKDSVIARSNYYLNLAMSTLSSISNSAAYAELLGQLLPASFQTGHGGVPTIAQWQRNINTMLARNIILNKLNPFVNGVINSRIVKSSTTLMTATDWANVLSYANKGIQSGDIVFTGHSSSLNSVFSTPRGSIAAMTTGPNLNTIFKISERFIQCFKNGDKRLANNFNIATEYFNLNFSTRYSLINGGSGLAGVNVYGSLSVGANEVYMAGSYEENALMLAEANIMLGQVEQGLSYVDAVRNYQGAGLNSVIGSGLSQARALQELVKERRVALVFRGLSFYDLRRWGWTYSIANGGGSYGNIFVTTTNKLYNNATIDYNFLDYWDVPADEWVLNPPSLGSVATINPNF